MLKPLNTAIAYLLDMMWTEHRNTALCGRQMKKAALKWMP